MQSIEARIPDVSTAQVLPVISDFADLLELPLETRADSLTLRLTGGQIALRDSLGGIDLRLEAESARRLYRLQQMVLTRFDGLDPVPHLDWERVDVGALPPGQAASSLSQGARLLPGMRRDILSCPRRSGPAYLTISVAANFLGILIPVLWMVWRMDPMYQIMIMVPLSVSLLLALLPRFKGMMVTWQWPKRMHGF